MTSLENTPRGHKYPFCSNPPSMSYFNAAVVPSIATHSVVALQRRLVPPPHLLSSQSIFIISARLRPLLPVNLRRSPPERI